MLNCVKMCHIIYVQCLDSMMIKIYAIHDQHNAAHTTFSKRMSVNRVENDIAK